MFKLLASDISLVKIPDISIDVPIWVHVIVITSSLCVLGATVLHLRKMSKRNSVSAHRYHPVWRIATIASLLFAILIVINSIKEMVDRVSNQSANGPPVVFVQPQSTFLGSDIVACIPNIEGSGGVNLPGWTIVGPVLFNTPRPKYNALVRIPVGIDNFSEVVKTTWKENTYTQHSETGNEKVFSVSTTIPTPQVLDRYGILYTAGEKNKLSSSAMETEFGEANRRCGGPSRFHDGSAGGILYNGANMVAGWFGKADQEDVNKLQSHAVDLAYELANKRDSKAFNGKSALEQARYITGRGVEELIRSLNGSKIAELEAKGYRIEVNIQFTDDGT